VVGRGLSTPVTPPASRAEQEDREKSCARERCPRSRRARRRGPQGAGAPREEGRGAEGEHRGPEAEPDGYRSSREETGSCAQRVVGVGLSGERDPERETDRQERPPHGVVRTAGSDDGADRRERNQHERHKWDEPGRRPIRDLTPSGEAQQIEEDQERREHDRERPQRPGGPRSMNQDEPDPTPWGWLTVLGGPGGSVLGIRRGAPPSLAHLR
jgi:hypothetical protein